MTVQSTVIDINDEIDRLGFYGPWETKCFAYINEDGYPCVTDGEALTWRVDGEQLLEKLGEIKEHDFDAIVDALDECVF